MTNQTILDRIIKNLAFEVEAVPIRGPEIASKSTPMNVKIRFKKKSEVLKNKNNITISQLEKQTEPRHVIRLIHSDQTIVSFNMLMEDVKIKKNPKKMRNIFLRTLKPGMRSKDNNEDYPYMPTTSYSAKVVKDDISQFATGHRDLLKQTFILSKNAYQTYTATNRTPTRFFGKCKPGGCLDPPRDEEIYSYKPKKTASQSKTIIDASKENFAVQVKDNINIEHSKKEIEEKSTGRRSSTISNGILFEKKRKANQELNDSVLKDNELQFSPDSVDTFSNSVLIPLNNIKSPSVSLDSRRNSKNKSFDELPETFYMPPKRSNRSSDSNTFTKRVVSDSKPGLITILSNPSPRTSSRQKLNSVDRKGDEMQLSPESSIVLDSIKMHDKTGEKQVSPELAKILTMPSLPVSSFPSDRNLAKDLTDLKETQNEIENNPNTIEYTQEDSKQISLNVKSSKQNIKISDFSLISDDQNLLKMISEKNIITSDTSHIFHDDENVIIEQPNLSNINRESEIIDDSNKLKVKSNRKYQIDIPPQKSSNKQGNSDLAIRNESKNSSVSDDLKNLFNNRESVHLKPYFVIESVNKPVINRTSEHHDKQSNLVDKQNINNVNSSNLSQVLDSQESFNIKHTDRELNAIKSITEQQIIRKSNISNVSDKNLKIKASETNAKNIPGSDGARKQSFEKSNLIDTYNKENFKGISHEIEPNNIYVNTLSIESGKYELTDVLFNTKDIKARSPSQGSAQVSAKGKSSEEQATNVCDVVKNNDLKTLTHDTDMNYDSDGAKKPKLSDLEKSDDELTIKSHDTEFLKASDLMLSLSEKHLSKSVIGNEPFKSDSTKTSLNEQLNTQSDTLRYNESVPNVTLNKINDASFKLQSYDECFTLFEHETHYDIKLPDIPTNKIEEDHQTTSTYSSHISNEPVASPLRSQDNPIGSDIQRFMSKGNEENQIYGNTNNTIKVIPESYINSDVKPEITTLSEPLITKISHEINRKPDKSLALDQVQLRSQSKNDSKMINKQSLSFNKDSNDKDPKDITKPLLFPISEDDKISYTDSKIKIYDKNNISALSEIATFKNKNTSSVKLAFHRYTNHKSERKIRTFDPNIEPKRFVNDNIMIITSEQLKLSSPDVRISVDSKHDLCIKLKKSINKENVDKIGTNPVFVSDHNISERQNWKTKHPGTSLRKSANDTKYYPDRTLVQLYEEELFLLKIIIESLKNEVNGLASKQAALRGKISKKLKPPVHSNKNCGCTSKNYRLN